MASVKGPRWLLLSVEEVARIYIEEFDDLAYESALDAMKKARGLQRDEDERFWQAVARVIGFSLADKTPM